MDDRRPDQRTSTTMEPWDELVREPLPREPRPPQLPRLPRLPRSPRMRALLGGVAALLVVAVVGTAALASRDRRAPAPPAASATLSARATATVLPRATATPAPMPKDYGWTQVTRLAGDVKFSASSPQRGYLCGMDQSGHVVVGVTSDGGQTWEFGPSPTTYESCALQISPTNALDVALTSREGACATPCPRLDAHSSTDGGATWQVAPLPQNTVAPGGAVWSGAYLYAWAGANKDSGQSGFLMVSADGSPFVSRDLATLLPGAQDVSILSPVAGDAKLYLNLTYTGAECSSQDCQAIVASGDGGKTWARVPNQSDIQLVYAVGNTLYAQKVEGTTTTLVLSSDDGASWTAQTLPPLPGGQPLRLSAQGSWVPTPDGTIFTTSTDQGAVAYLRAGAWTVIPFEPWPDAIATVSLDANGQPQRVWGLNSPQTSLGGIYWHALP